MPERQPALIPETSSAPVKIPEEQQTLFREILTLLERQHIPYAVAGAFALQGSSQRILRRLDHGHE